MSWTEHDICQRCVTTHPRDEDGRRPCPKPPTPKRPEPDNDFATISFGADCFTTRGFGRSANTPALTGVNPGHEPVNSSHIGLTASQCERLGL